MTLGSNSTEIKLASAIAYLQGRGKYLNVPVSTVDTDVSLTIANYRKEEQGKIDEQGLIEKFYGRDYGNSPSS